jgi:hypothetical protein
VNLVFLQSMRLRALKAASAALPKPRPRKRKQDELAVPTATESNRATLPDRAEEAIMQQRGRRVRFEEDESANLQDDGDQTRPRKRQMRQRDGDDIMRATRRRVRRGPRQPTIMNARTPEPATDRWTYEDHRELINSLTAPHPEPITEAPVYGTKRGNEVFDRATQMLKNFDDMDESLPAINHDLKLNWQEDEDLLAEVPVRNGGLQYVQSTLRDRIVLPASPGLNYETAVDQANMMEGGRRMTTGEAPLFEESTADMWDNARELAGSEEVSHFSWFE